MKTKLSYLPFVTGAFVAALVGAMADPAVQAQQVPIPKTAAEVRGPAPGPMTKAYVQMVGRMAYVWGWPLVYVYNQRTELTKVPEPAPAGSFSIWLRAYWPDQPILDGTWKPPSVSRVTKGDTGQAK